MLVIEITFLTEIKRERFISYSRIISDRFNCENYILEYTSKKGFNSEVFKSFPPIENYFNNGERFDQIKFENQSEVIGFKFSQGKFYIYGLLLDSDFIKKMIYENIEEINFSYIHNDLDFALSRNNNPRIWEKKLGEIPSEMTIYENPRSISSRDTHLVDLETTPTHNHLMKNGERLWFGACAEMYFSPVYYKYIPKPLWDNFTDCQENQVLPNGIRRIKLYEDHENFLKPENRELQWKFRRQLGIDSIGHELCPANFRENLNLPVEISKKNCKQGDTRVSKFFDSDGNLSDSDKAVFKEVTEYLEDGITVVFNETKEVKG